MSLKFEFATLARCGPEHIWRIFEDIERWPRWDPEAIQSARWVSGAPWEKGSRFELQITKPMSYTITPELLDVQPPIFIHWRGKGSGVTGEQFFIFKPVADGATEMHTLQEFSGAPVALLGGKMRGSIQAGIEHMFSRIKSEAEHLANEAATQAVSTPATPAETSIVSPPEVQGQPQAEIPPEGLAQMLATSLAKSLETTPVSETPALELTAQQKTDIGESSAPDNKQSETKQEEQEDPSRPD